MLTKQGKITLRTIKTSDWEYIYTLENDPEVWSYSTLCDAPYTKEEIIDFCSHLESNSTKIDSDGQLRLIIQDNDNIIGTIDLYQTDIASSSAFVAIIIYPAHYRNKGYGKEAFYQFKNLCKDSLKITKLLSQIDNNNHTSFLFFQSCGFKLISKNIDYSTLFLEL